MKYILMVTKNKWLRVIDVGMFKTVISLEKEKRNFFFNYTSEKIIPTEHYKITRNFKK